MGKGSNTNTVTKDAEPWAGQAPYLKDLYSQAQNQFNQGPAQFYPDQTYANVNDLSLQAEQMLQNNALGQQSTLANSLTPAFEGSLMNPSDIFSDPMFQQSLTAGLRPIQQGMETGLQQARRGATEAGQLGGSRQGILESEVIKDYLTKSNDVAAQMYGDIYGDLSKTRTAALGLTPTILSAYNTPAQTLGAVGGLQQGRDQQAINEAMQRFNFGQQAPGQGLNAYGNIVAGSILPPSVTSSSEGGGVSDLAATTGGAATGAALGSMFGGETFMTSFGPWGAAAGALYGLLSN